MNIINKKLIAIVVVVLIVVVVGIYFLISANNKNSVSPIPSGWKMYSDKENGFSFNYIEKFGANVWHTMEWPPRVTVITNGEDPVKTGCPNLSLSDSNPASVSGKATNGAPYTLFQSSGVGAGQLYSFYCYVFTQNTKKIVLDFEIQSANGCGNDNCGPYCSTQFENECRTLDFTKDIETPIQTMANSFVIK